MLIYILKCYLITNFNLALHDTDNNGGSQSIIKVVYGGMIEKRLRVPRVAV